MNLLFLLSIILLFVVTFVGRVVMAKRAKELEGEGRDDMLVLAAQNAKAPALMDLINRYTTMARARVVRVQNTSLTVIYARENGTKGRVTFEMDTAFDDVREGDVGVFVIIDQEIHGNAPFYKFIRDAGIPTIDEILELGTGDALTDRIYQAAVGKERRKPKAMVEFDTEPESEEIDDLHALRPNA